MSRAPEQRAEDLARFMQMVRIGPRHCDCWIWAGNRPDGRYGHFSVGGEVVKAHRWIYEIAVGLIPDGAVLRHRCDEPSCVNPMHLDPGTHAQNSQDAVERGRWSSRQGVKHPLAVLTETEVREIRRRASCGETQKQIADRFEISSQHVGKIVRRECWGHVQ